MFPPFRSANYTLRCTVFVFGSSRHHYLSYWRPGAARLHNRDMAENIMPAIPGEYLSPSRYWMPSPETACDTTHEVICTLPRFGPVRITYQRMTHKHGRMRSWFWTPVSAVRVIRT